MRKIKILYLITGLNPGGAENNLKKIVLKLPEQIFKISICSITKTNGIVNEIRNKVENIYFLNSNKYFKFFKALLELRKIIKKENPHIIHCFMYHSNILGRFAAIGLNCYVISSIRNKLIKNPLKNFIDKLTQKLVDLYLVNSKTLKKFITNYGINKNKIVLIENGVDIQNFSIKKNLIQIRNNLKLSKLPIITTVAHYRRQKDYPTLLYALSILQKDLKFNFLAVGASTTKRSEEKKIKNLISKLKLTNVKLLGYRNDIVDILSITDVWVSSTLYEGQSNSLLEAMIMKKAIVTTNIPENAEVVRDGKEAILVPIKSPFDIANALKKLFNNEGFSDKLANNAYQHACKRYNVKRMMKKLIFLYIFLVKSDLSFQ